MTISDSHVERAVSVTAGPARRARRRGATFDDGLMGVALLAGPANVIMQLARPGVGYGVMESRVESGRVDRHPIKRARTTFTYLAVATKGSESQKAAYRRAVNKAHAQVYSTDESPVKYHAFDKDLQLWVAACLYKGGVDIYRLFIGEFDDATADQHYLDGMSLGTTLQVPAEMWPADQHYLDGMSLGTTLQVPAEMWPADRKAFDEYWQKSLEQVHIDDAVRDYLYPIAANRIRGVKLPKAIQRRMDESALLITTGFLPQKFRDEMRLPWDEKRQQRFNRVMKVLSTVNHALPGFVRQFPFNVLLWDLDRRVRKGIPLV